MARHAGIVLAGGRSSRMGRETASLEWHGSTLLRRVAGLVARGAGGPVVVVRAPGQPLPGDVEVVDDAREGRGPLEGLAAGLRTVAGRADVAYVSSTDAPLLHPALVRRVLGAVGPRIDAAVPHAGDPPHPHPLAAAYRLSLLPVVEELAGGDDLRLRLLLERCRVRWLDREALLADATLAAADPELRSLLN